MRILIDRLWPRGISKENAKIDLWLKDIGPSDELRKWFAHDPNKWHEFKRRYEDELKSNKAFEKLVNIALSTNPITLLYSAKDREHNNGVVLLEMLTKRVEEIKKPRNT